MKVFKGARGLQDDTSTYVTQLLLEKLPAARRRHTHGCDPAVLRAGIVQPLRGKGYLDEEREMRIFLPHPVPRCFRKVASTYKVLPRSRERHDKLQSFYGSGAGLVTALLHLPLAFPLSVSAGLALGVRGG